MVARQLLYIIDLAPARNNDLEQSRRVIHQPGWWSRGAAQAWPLRFIVSLEDLEKDLPCEASWVQYQFNFTPLQIRRSPGKCWQGELSTRPEAGTQLARENCGLALCESCLCEQIAGQVVGEEELEIGTVPQGVRGSKGFKMSRWSPALNPVCT